MPNVFTSSVLNGDGSYTGHFYYRPYGGAVDIEVALPAGVVTTGNQPFFVVYRGRLYILGQFRPNLVFTEHSTLHTVGLPAPLTVGVLSANGSGGAIGSPVSAKMYLTLAQKINDQIIHESNPGGVSNTVSASTYGFQMASLPTTSPDPRANTIRGYRSVDGAKARVAWERPLGATTVVDNVPTLQLGESMSLLRGIPPLSNVAGVYDERMWWVDPAKPQNVLYSLRGEPEGVSALNFLPTKEGEPIVGVWRHGDQLLLGCPNCFYDIQRYGDNDYALRKISSIYGLISPWSFATIGDTTWFWSQYGPVMYNGGFVFQAENMRDYFKAQYEANRAAYERAIAVNDPVEHLYSVSVQLGVNPKGLSLWGTYNDVLRQGKANARWGFDVQTRPITARGVLQDFSGRRLAVYNGSDDGIVRLENVAADAQDDSDTYHKKFIAEGPHEYFEEEGGDRNHGKKFTDYTVFLKNENQAATVKLFAGNDNASSGQPRKTKTVPAGAVVGKVARSAYPFPPMCAGEGLTTRVEVDSPVGVEYRGNAGAWIDGQKSRPAT